MTSLSGSRGVIRANDPAELSAALDESLPISPRDGGVIRNGFHSDLDHLRSLAAGGKQWMASYQAAEVERTGIPSMKSDGLEM